MQRTDDRRYACPHCGEQLHKIRVRELDGLEMRFVTVAQMRDYLAWQKGVAEDRRTSIEFGVIAALSLVGIGAMVYGYL